MKKKLIFFVIITLAGFFGGAVIDSLIKTNTIELSVEHFTSSFALIGAGILALIALISQLDTKSSSSSSNVKGNKGRTEDGKEVKQYYSTRWVTEKELLTNPKFMFSYYSDLKNNARDGIVIRAERKNNRTLVNMVKPIHTIVIGTTGSGKTTMLVDPTIQILSETKSKPSMVISDPKGELYAHNAEKLKQCGYDVQVIDLREPDKSSRWNPLERAYDYYQRAHNLVKEVKQHVNDPVSKYPHLLKPANATFGNTWFEFDGVAYNDINALKQDMKALKEKLKDTAMEDILDIATTLCPIEGQDPSWSRGAQGLIQAIMIAMLEDSLIPELGMTKEKFNFFNVAKIAGIRDAGQDNIVTLRNYFQGRPVTSECVEMANTVVMNAASTSKGYLGHVTGALKVFSGDMGVCYLTSGTDIDFQHFADRPSALFLKIPDEKDTRNGIANMFISQLYKMLIERANENAKKTGKEPELPRNVYFLLDEFGNLPKIARLKSFITAGRSRKIFLMLVIQDYTQLNSIYGEQDAATIRNNCNIHIFIGTKDAKTREEFSRNAGNQALIIENVNKSTSSNSQEYGSSRNESKSTSVNTVQKPLISPDELDHLENNQVVINMFGEFTLKTIFTPTYKNPTYSFIKAPIEYVPSRYLDKEAVYYDIKKRNELILKNDDDDGDFDFGGFRR